MLIIQSLKVGLSGMRFGMRPFSELIPRDGVAEHINPPVVVSAVNYLSNQSIVYPIAVKEFFKLRKDPSTFTVSDQIEDFLKQQKEEDTMLIKPPKEVVFIGRSNVGKSSLINAIVGDKLCLASNTPGRTSKLQFLHLSNKQGAIVDAPGYGWTKAGVKIKKKWVKLLNQYLCSSTRICRVFVLINMEHGVKTSDFEYLDLVNRYNHSIQVVLTKCDRVREEEFEARILAIGQQIKQFKNVNEIIHIVSTKSKFGIDQLRDAVIASFMYYYNKEELERLKYKSVKATDIRPPGEKIEETPGQGNQIVPPPSEMFKLLYTPKDL